MARVKDTRYFTDKARSVHGDKYDYSQSVYNGTNDPITIICPEHGAFTLKRAGSHHKHGQGCKKCRRKSYPCKICGGPIYGREKPRKKSKRYCSVSCREVWKQSNRTFVECVVCGVAVERTLAAVEKREAFCCGLECQRQWSFQENHSAYKNVDWLERSRRAKATYKKSSQNRRRKENRVLQAVKRELARLKSRTDGRLKSANPSLYDRIARRLRMNKGRVGKRYVKPKGGTIDSELRRLEAMARRCPLRTKIQSKISAMKKRRSRTGWELET